MFKVFIGSPVRNRGWILQEHLDALKIQSGICKQFCYVVNNCTDDTVNILRKNKIPHVIHNIEYPTLSWIRGQYSFTDLAIVRNVLLEEFLKSDCDYLFSIDSDIILQNETNIFDLVINNRDIVSALINNSPVIYAHNILIGGRQPNITKEGIIPVDVTGAVYLIRRDVIESGVRYGYHQYGEDAAFCEHAKDRGYELYCDTSIHAKHVYSKNQYLLPNIIQKETKMS